MPKYIYPLSYCQHTTPFYRENIIKNYKKIDGFAVGGRSGFSPVYQDVWLAKYQQGTVQYTFPAI
jgi:hypothetical protein